MLVEEEKYPYWPQLFVEHPFVSHDDGTFLLDAFPLKKGKECYMVFEPMEKQKLKDDIERLLTILDDAEEPPNIEELSL